MALSPIQHANTNLRWCLRAWNDGEMRDLALYLYRKALSQLFMADISPETIASVVVDALGQNVVNDLGRFNEEVINSDSAYAGWLDRVACLHIC